MKKTFLIAITAFISYQTSVMAQANRVSVNSVIEAEDNFNKLVARKGIKDAFLSVADPEGIVFKPQAIKITDFYSHIEKQPGLLQWKPKLARISASGDLAFTAGPYTYQNGKSEDDKVYGDYVSIWRTDADNKLKLLIDLGIQHPEADLEEIADIKEPDLNKKVSPNKDPFGGKNVIMLTDKTLNQSLTASTLAAYHEFLSAEGRYYFPGFEPITGSDKILKFINNEAINISAETINAGRSISNDLAYSYGHARIQKGQVVSNYNYVRIWELNNDTHKWYILLEVFSAIENQ